MFRWLWTRTPSEIGLTLEQAKVIFEAEITRCGWPRFRRANLLTVPNKQRSRWHCQGVLSGIRGPVMNIRIDAQTGKLVSTTAGGR